MNTIKNIVSFVDTMNIKILHIIVIFILCDVLLPASVFRLVDLDEGFYLYAGRLVYEGKMPYIDFFYPQMPLLPYVYGLWMKIFGVSWYSVRLLSGMLSVIIGWLIFKYVLHAQRKQSIAFLAVLLYAFSSFSFGWFITTKTFALSALFLFASYTLLELSPKMSRTPTFFAGILLGISVDARLTIAGTVPVFLWWIYRRTSNNRVVLPVIFLAGTILATLPNLYFVWLDWDTYYFSNMGYHLIREEMGIVQNILNKLSVYQSLILNPHYMPLVVISLYVMLSRFYRREPIPLALGIAIVLILVHTTPRKIYIQYFAITIPFLIVVTTDFVAQYNFSKSDKNRSRIRSWAPSAFLIALSLYLVFSPIEYYRYMYWGKKVPGIEKPRFASSLSIPEIRKVSKEIDKIVSESGVVASIWPGHMLEAKAKIYPNMENRFGIKIGHKITKKQRRKYHIISFRELTEIIKNGYAEIVVLFPSRNPGITSFIQHYNYRGIRRVGGAVIYSPTKWPGARP